MTRTTQSAGYAGWPPEVAEGYRRSGYWRGETLGELLAVWASERPDREALVGPNARLTYGELKQAADTLSRRLRTAGIGGGDRVVVQLPNVPEFVLLCFSLFGIGAIPVLALPAHREYEIAHVAGLSGAKALAIPVEYRGFRYGPMARAVAAQVPSLSHLLTLGTGGRGSPITVHRFQTKVRQDGPLPYRYGEATPPAPSEVALFLLSGGTTGRPKLIPRTHDDYLYCARGSARLCNFGPETRYLAVLPASHNFPLVSPGILGTLYEGGTVVMCPTNDPDTVFEVVEREGVTVTSVVPALAARLLESFAPDSHDLSSLRLLQVGGAKLSPTAAAALEGQFGCRLQQVFGMAEGLVNYTRLDDPPGVAWETQGRPMSEADELRIVDESGRDVGAGERGELLVRGPYTVRGYYGEPDQNRRSFTPEGFYKTGDVVRVHPSGNLVVEGRRKDLVNRGGEKISAEEVEGILAAHPKVRAVAVVAVPDPAMGERACACVVPRGNHPPSLAELAAFLTDRGVAPYKRPEKLEILRSLPLTGIGKVDKRALRDEVGARLLARRGGAPGGG